MTGAPLVLSTRPIAPLLLPIVSTPVPGPGPSPADAASTGADVAVLLVSHDGARWLPGVLEGLAEQGPLGSMVAVDTGSLDDSAALLAPSADVVSASSATSYPAAVRLGLEHLSSTGSAPEWIWLLHDDSRPAPGALAALLSAAAARPDVDILGPKLREWPSLRRLLEVGVTISGTGRRETGLERGEYDQGQHDTQREVLAVNTAGMLVRRRVLEELGGFDDQLPLFGNDIDFGWRAAEAGHTTLVVPDAVVFHAEAAHRGVRRTQLTGSHTHFQERRAALYTLLVNSRGRSLPWRIVRLTLGTMVRMLGFLLVRSVSEALDDFAALVSVLSNPRTLRDGRRARRAGSPDPERSARLLAPAWVPYRHGLDSVGDLAAALTNQAADVAERRRIVAAERDPSSQAAVRVRAEEDEDDYVDTGLVARYLSNPVALALTAVVAIALVGARTAFGAVSGGRLSPAPETAGVWWDLVHESWHPLAFGTDVPAPAYLQPLALLASVVGPSGAISLVMLLAVPVTLWGAWRFLRVAGRLVAPAGAPRWLLVAGSTTYAVVPVTSGAWGDGRLGLVVAAAGLPWLAHAALGFADPDPERRWRAGWRVGLLLALVAAFAPLAWVLAVVLVLVVLGAGLGLARGVIAAADVALPPVLALAVPVVLLAPWWVTALVRGAGGALLLGAGRPSDARIDPLDVLSGRVSDVGAPTAIGLLLLVLAVLALVPRPTRIPVTLCWTVVLFTTLVAVALARVDVDLLVGSSPADIGILVITIQAALVAAVVLGAEGIVRARPTRAVRTAGALVGIVGAVVPLAGLAWTLIGDDHLVSSPPREVPAYMVQSSKTGPEHGILVVRGAVETGLTYSVRRDDGPTVGEDEIVALSEADPAAHEIVTTFLSRPTGAAVEALGGLGIEWVLQPAPADGSVAASLDATSGLNQASTDPGSRAWQVNRGITDAALDGPDAAWRTVLFVLQGVALLVVLVLCLPTIRSRDEEETS